MGERTGRDRGLLATLLLSGCAASDVLPPPLETAEVPRILVIHSRPRGHRAADRFDAGFDRVAATRGRFRVERHALSPGAAGGAFVLAVIEGWRPAVVVTVGDAAQAAVGRHLVDRADPLLVYADVRADPARFGYERGRAWGLVERPRFDASAALVDDLVAPIDRVGLLFEDSRAGIAAEAWAPEARLAERVVASARVGSLGAWRGALRRFQGEVDAVGVWLEGPLPTARGALVSPPALLARARRILEVPVFGFTAEAVEAGALVGQVRSDEATGAAAAELACALALGEAPAPGEYPAPAGLAVVNEGALAAFGLRLGPTLLERYDRRVPGAAAVASSAAPAAR